MTLHGGTGTRSVLQLCAPSPSKVIPVKCDYKKLIQTFFFLFLNMNHDLKVLKVSVNYLVRSLLFNNEMGSVDDF